MKVTLKCVSERCDSDSVVGQDRERYKSVHNVGEMFKERWCDSQQVLLWPNDVVIQNHPTYTCSSVTFGYAFQLLIVNGPSYTIYRNQSTIEYFFNVLIRLMVSFCTTE